MLLLLCCCLRKGLGGVIPKMYFLKYIFLRCIFELIQLYIVSKKKRKNYMYFSYPKHKSISQIFQDQSNAKVLQKIIQQSNINRKKATSQTPLKIEIVECRKLFFSKPT